MAASALLSSLCLAASFAVPEMPDAEWDDTEVVTNAALPAARADSRVFAFSLELDATASNNVEVAFGRDADHDGVLSRGEADLLVGWDCGEWKIVDCASGDETIEQGTGGRVRMAAPRLTGGWSSTRQMRRARFRPLLTDAPRSRRPRHIRRASSTRRNGTRCASSAGAWILRAP